MSRPRCTCGAIDSAGHIAVHAGACARYAPGTPAGASREDFERMESLIGTPHLPDSEDDDALRRVLEEAREAQRLRETWPPIDYRINDGVEEDHPLAIISRLRSRVEQLEGALRNFQYSIVAECSESQYDDDALRTEWEGSLRLAVDCIRDNLIAELEHRRAALSAAPKEDDDE